MCACNGKPAVADRDATARRVCTAVAVVLLGVVLTCAGVVGVGCGPTPPSQGVNTPEREAALEKARVERQAKFVKTLPRDITDVRDEGGDNVSYTMVRDGHAHRYMAHYAWDSRSAIFTSSLVRLD